ncbi:MAG: hypothetical protein R3F38_04455 [Gammaproteobacteria bacterium]
MNRTLPHPGCCSHFALSACGGGGGGGGSSSPANVNPGPGNNNGSGSSNRIANRCIHRCSRGRPAVHARSAQQGVTNAQGQFSYDANSGEKVGF